MGYVHINEVKRSGLPHGSDKVSFNGWDLTDRTFWFSESECRIVGFPVKRDEKPVGYENRSFQYFELFDRGSVREKIILLDHEDLEPYEMTSYELKTQLGITSRKKELVHIGFTYKQEKNEWPELTKVFDIRKTDYWRKDRVRRKLDKGSVGENGQNSNSSFTR